MRKIKVARFDSGRQDKTMKLLLTDTEFIASTRKFLRPRYFTSAILQHLSGEVFRFFDLYGAAPNYEQVDDILTSLVINNIVSEDEMDVYLSYIDRLMSDVPVTGIVREALLSNLKEYACQSVLQAVSKAIKKGSERNMTSSAVLEYVVQAVDEVRSITSESSIITLSDVIRRDRIVSEAVTCFNIDVLDNALDGGMQRGFFYVIVGYTGAGKTWMLVHLGKMAARLGYLVVHIVIELSNTVLGKRYKMALSARNAQELSRDYKYVGEIVRKALVKRSNIYFVDEEEKSASVDSLRKIVDDVKRQYGRKPDLILIDSAEDYLPPAGGKYRDEWAGERAVFTYLKDFSRSENICVVSSVQAVKKSEKTQWLSTAHCAGAAEKVRKAAVGISINTTLGEMGLGYYRLFVFKNNEGATGCRVWAKRNLARGQAVIDSGRYDKRYWDILEGEMEGRKGAK